MAIINEKVLAKLISGPEFSEIALRLIKGVYDYAGVVMRYDDELASARISHQGEPKSYQESVQDIEKARTSKHDKAISSLSALNNLAERRGLDPVYPGLNDEHRGDIAHAIFALCKNRLDADGYGKDWRS